MDNNSADQSTRKQKEKEPMRIRYNLLDLKMNDEHKAKCKLRMPANFSAFYGPRNESDPLLVLDVKDPSDNHCVRIMRECLHRNVLHCRVVMEKDPFLLVLVENYTGMLLTYLKSTDPYIPMSKKASEPHMIPYPELQFVVTQLLDGLCALWKYGKCHGNFKLATTPYLKTTNGNIVPKLADFKYCKVSGTKPVSHYQAQDAKSFGEGLSEISDIAKDFNRQGYSLDCSQIDHVAKRLKSVSLGDLWDAIKEVRSYPFFWTEVESKDFFVSRVPLALDSSTVRKKIEEAKDLCTLPWNNHAYNGFLPLMINYGKKKNLPAYDFNNSLHYVQFISGLYTHEFQLKRPYGSVHTTVKLSNPRLYVTLYSLLPPAQRSINQD